LIHKKSYNDSIIELMLKISIIIPTHNHLEDCLKPCLESLIKYTVLDNAEVIIVANGCTDDTKEYVESLGKPFKLLWFDEPLGYTKATNEGIKVSSGKYVVLLNDDTLFLDQDKNSWIKMLLEPFEQNKKIGITGPLQKWDDDLKKSFIVFFCAMISREVIDKVGLLDERFSPGGAEDIDYCMRAMGEKYQIMQVPSTNILEGNERFMIGSFPIYHKGEMTVREIEDWEEIFGENMKKLKRKYQDGFDFDQKVGIIMPAHNSLKTLNKSINAIINQTYKNWELIIVDDGSTDNTPHVCNALRALDERITVFRTASNQGPSASRNYALMVLRNKGHEMIAYCDSDDVWNSDHLFNSLKILHENEDIDMVYSDAKFVNEKKEELTSFGIQEVNEFDVEKLREGNFIYLSTVVHRACCMDVGEFDSKLDSIEDWDYWLRIAEKGHGIFHNKNVQITYLVKQDGVAGRCNDQIKALFDEKRNSNPPLKLNLGCGDQILGGYINCDMYNAKADMQFDAKEIPYEDDTVDEIFASHLLEHFSYAEIDGILKEWKRALKPGGKLVIETPDAYHSYKRFCEAYEKGDTFWQNKLYGHLHAFPWVEGQVHKFLFTENQLGVFLSQAGFINAKRVIPDSFYSVNNPPELYLKMECEKP